MYTEIQYLGAAAAMENAAAELIAQAFLMRHTAAITSGELTLDDDIHEFVDECIQGNWDVVESVHAKIDFILRDGMGE